MENNIREALDELLTPFLDAKEDNFKAAEASALMTKLVANFVRDISTLLAENPESKVRAYNEMLVRERTASLLKELVLETIKDLESQ